MAFDTVCLLRQNPTNPNHRVAHSDRVTFVKILKIIKCNTNAKQMLESGGPPSHPQAKWREGEKKRTKLSHTHRWKCPMPVRKTIEVVIIRGWCGWCSLLPTTHTYGFVKMHLEDVIDHRLVRERSDDRRQRGRRRRHLRVKSGGKEHILPLQRHRYILQLLSLFP